MYIIANSKMTGTFLNGKPQGNFVASYPGEHYTSEANVTMKNGKYVNSYYYSGTDGYKWHSYKGQLTADGKLTGKWTIETEASPTVTLEFVNNICVSRSEKNFSTPPHVTAKARQYAEGKISKEKILESGLVIKRKSIALNDVLYLLNYNEFSLERIPGDYSMEDYDHEQYYEEVIQLPTFSDAEYEEFLKARENGKAFDFGNRTCNTSSIKLDKEYGLYNVEGWDYDQGARIYIYFTDKQTKQFQEPLMANPIKFSELIKSESFFMYSVFVPQHPPTSPAPIFRILFIAFTKSSASTSKTVLPSATLGNPAFGFTITGTEAFFIRRSTRSIMSSGPRLQFNPRASTPSPSSIVTIHSGVEPLKVLHSVS